MAKVPLMECVARTRELAARIEAKDYDTALLMRGDRYTEMIHVFRSISRALPSTARTKARATRIALLNVGGLAPGMNAVAGAAVRLGLDRGHTMLGVNGSFRGLMDGDVQELTWGDVEGWTSLGGAELGISRQVPTVNDLYAIGRGLEDQRVDGLLIIGGWDAFEAACTMQRERARYPAFQVPTIYLPATIDNNIPGSELSVGADSALGLIVDSIDRVRQAGIATRRCFVVETMGGQCGYLALLGGLSGGAVRVYLHEEGITLQELAHDVERMVESFPGRAAALPGRDEREGQSHVHQRLPVPAVQPGEPGAVRRPRGGPRPDPAGRRAVPVRPDPRHPAGRALDRLAQPPDRERRHRGAVIGLSEGKVRVAPLRDAEELADWEYRRPQAQWWMRLRPLIDVRSPTGSRSIRASRSSKETTLPVPGTVESSSRTAIRTTLSPASTVSSTGASGWRRALATSSLAIRPRRRPG